MNIFWQEFTVLFILAAIGGAAIVPYSLRLLEGAIKKKPTKLSMKQLMLISYLQTLVISAITVLVGLWAAHHVGLGAPLIESVLTGRGLPPNTTEVTLGSLYLGAAAGLLLGAADWLMLPRLPKQLVDLALKTTLGENFTASFYGGINEELLTRLFGMSLVAWGLSFFWHTPAGLPTGGALWLANLVLATLFAAGHLPALIGIVGRPTPLLLVRTFGLNIPIGLLCGWLFWKFGIEAAMIAHFTADIVYHVGGTLVLQRSAISAKK